MYDNYILVNVKNYTKPVTVPIAKYIRLCKMVSSRANNIALLVVYQYSCHY